MTMHAARSIVGALFAVAVSTPASAAIREEPVSYKDDDTVMKGFVVYDDATQARRPGIVVVHEWWGITKHVHDSARSLAALGYTAFIADMYGEGKTADNPKTAGELSGSVRKNPALMQARFNAARDALARHATVDPKRIGAVGFCFGGSVALDMAQVGADLAGVAAFHAGLTTSTPAAPGKVKYHYIDYQGAVHAFTNPEATEAGKKFNLPLAYNAAADKQSKAEMAKFFAEIFGKK